MWKLRTVCQKGEPGRSLGMNESTKALLTSVLISRGGNQRVGIPWEGSPRAAGRCESWRKSLSWRGKGGKDRMGLCLCCGDCNLHFPFEIHTLCPADLHQVGVPRLPASGQASLSLSQAKIGYIHSWHLSKA